VVTTDQEHPSIYDSTAKFALQNCHERWTAHLDPETGFVESATIFILVDDKTRLVGLIHGSNMTGACLGIKGVTAGVRRINTNAMVVVDGVQRPPRAGGRRRPERRCLRVRSLKGVLRQGRWFRLSLRAHGQPAPLGARRKGLRRLKPG
jgi:hypothetical protein